MFYFKNGELFRTFGQDSSPKCERLWAWYYDLDTNTNNLLGYLNHCCFHGEKFLISEAYISKEKYLYFRRILGKLLLKEFNIAIKWSVEIRSYDVYMLNTMHCFDNTLDRVIRLLNILKELDEHAKKYVDL